MPTRKTVVIAPRSPLEFEGDSDYECKCIITADYVYTIY